MVARYSAMHRWLKTVVAALGLAGLQWLGDAVVAWTGWPVSGSLVGMLLLLIALVIRGSVPASLESVGAPVLRHLMLFLIPSVAAVTVHAELLARHATVFVLVCLSTTVLTAAVTALVLRKVLPVTPAQRP